MDAIQGLRQRAERAGNLRSNEQMRVTREGEHVVIEPAQPQVVYVPYYDPAVVYGPWWWPAYPPVYWGPPAGYYAGPGYWPGFYWGTGIAISWGFFYGHADWHHHQVYVAHGYPYHHAHGAPAAKPVKWQHDPVHRRNVPYRYAMSRQPFGQHPGIRGDGARGPLPGTSRAAHIPRLAMPRRRRARCRPRRIRVPSIPGVTRRKRASAGPGKAIAQETSAHSHALPNRGRQSQRHASARCPVRLLRHPSCAPTRAVTPRQRMRGPRRGANQNLLTARNRAARFARAS